MGQYDTLRYQSNNNMPPRRSKEFICGACASIVNTIVTYPISKVIFRQQIYGLTTSASLQQIQGEGAKFVYRGIMFPLMQRGICMSIMFGTYNTYTIWLIDNWPWQTTTGVRQLAAFFSGASEATFTPFERLQSLMQHKGFNHSVSNSFTGFNLVRQHGVRELYKGYYLIVLRNGFSNILFFSIKDLLKTHIPPPHDYTTLYNFAVGAGLGAFLSTLFYPVNVVKNRLQSSIGYEYSSLVQLFTKTYKEKGGTIQSLYKGVHLNYGRAILSWGIVNSVYEYLVTKL
ncbi:Solute carrier family 25 member 51 [Oopsacas minuta]|uniref:Solute carrier family 25 member 51 n=1 Tax=Oopsacas minuta TaxID=111878 RepID=A0AAV7K459_9METZ|nr:Solute carrier family 25 member 51 [Oopsacas minuta]